MNKYLNFSSLYKSQFYENFYVYIVLLSYFFLWDISFKTISFKYSIFFILIFILIKKIKLHKLKFSFYSLVFLTIHLLINKILFEIPLTFDNFKGIVLVFFSFLFVSVFKEKILDSLHNLFTYFPIFLVPFTLITLQHDSRYYQELDFKCSFLMFDSPFFKKIFLENSHYGMILPSLIIYNLYQLSIENKNFTKNFTRYISIFLIFISSLLFGSTTLSFGLIISIIFILLLLYKQLNSFFIVTSVLVLIFYSIIFNSKSACNSKILDLSTYIDQIDVQKDNFDQSNLLDNKYKKLENELNVKVNQYKNQLQILKDEIVIQGLDPQKYEYIFIDGDFQKLIDTLKSEGFIITNNFSKIINELSSKSDDLHQISKQRQSLNVQIKTNNNDIKTNFNTVNLSTQVIIKSLITAYKSILDNPIGYGVNSYEFAYFKYNTTEIDKSFFSKDTFYINYNDAASNLPKIITEFGILNLLLITLFIFFIFNKNIDLRYKLLILPIVLTLNLRAAGYFNAGFTICIIQVLFLCTVKKNDLFK